MSDYGSDFVDIQWMFSIHPLRLAMSGGDLGPTNQFRQEWAGLGLHDSVGHPLWGEGDIDFLPLLFHCFASAAEY